MERVESYLHSSGLDGKTVPKVLGTFLSAKYLTWGMFIAVSMRYRPFRSLFLERRKVLPVTLPRSQWTGQQLRLIGSRARQRRRAAVRGMATTAISDSSISVRSATRLRNGIGHAWALARARSGSLISHGRSRWRSRCDVLCARGGRYQQQAGMHLQRLWRAHHRHIASRKLSLRARYQNTGWYERASAKYWMLSDKLVSVSNKSILWTSVARMLRLNPSQFALSMAEGTLFYKVTFLLHAPLQLWCIVQYFKR